MFTVSIPILSASVNEILLNIINQCTRYDLNNMYVEDNELKEVLQEGADEYNDFKVKENTKKKISSIAKMAMTLSKRKEDLAKEIEIAKNNSFSDGLIEHD